jgi:hypothetical protein
LRGTERFLQRLSHIEMQVVTDSAGKSKNTCIEAAHQDDFRATPGIREEAEKLDPVASGHLQVEEHDTRRRLRSQSGLEYRGIGRDSYREVDGFRHLLDDLQKGGFVVDG